MNLESIIRRINEDRPAFSQWDLDLTWQMTPGTLRLIAPRLEHRSRTLEVGCGASTILFVGAGTRHAVVTGDPDEERLVRSYCDRLGISHSQLQFIIGRSDSVLPSLGLTSELEFGLIDGSHSFPYPIVDWHYMSKFLRVGGTMVIDDIEIPAVRIIYNNMLVDPAWKHVGSVDNRGAAFVKMDELDTTDQWQIQPFTVHFVDNPL